MKVIENYEKAIENSDESLLKEVFAPQVRIEIPAGASDNHPVNTASYSLSQVAKSAPAIKCVLSADAGNNRYFLGFEGKIEGQKLQAGGRSAAPQQRWQDRSTHYLHVSLSGGPEVAELISQRLQSTG